MTETMMQKLGLTADDLKIQNNNPKLEKLMDLISIDRVPSDKLGYDWEIIKIGELEVQKKYVVNDDAKGTKENPYTDDSVLTDNAYYIIDGIHYVCMGGELIEFDWE